MELIERFRRAPVSWKGGIVFGVCVGVFMALLWWKTWLSLPIIGLIFLFWALWILVSVPATVFGEDPARWRQRPPMIVRYDGLVFWLSSTTAGLAVFVVVYFFR